ncbi:unnamed protein product [Diplocarpon coronariae]
MTPRPGLRLDLTKGKEKEVLSIELPIASSFTTNESPEDDNNDKDEDNNNAMI